MDLAGAVCLVTGASSGIGRAAAGRLGREGASLLVHGRDEERLRQVAAETGGHPLRADLEVPGGPDALAAGALEVFGRVDVLVNNAGFGWAGSFAEMEAGTIEGLVTAHLTAAIRLTRAVLPGMLERRRGAIVNVASIAGHVGVRDEAVYAAAKAGLVGFSESLRYEVRQSGVSVTVVSPGPVATPFFERRGRPYGRRFPRPVPADRVAEALVRAVKRGRPQVFVPGWLAFPAWLRGAWPGLYRAAAGRFG